MVRGVCACQFDNCAWLQEMLVLYRRKSSPSWLKRLKEKVFGEEEGPRLMRREPIMLRVLRDIPVPSWKLVLPDKLLQFRPLDGLRADLVTVAGDRPATAPHTCREWLLRRALRLVKVFRTCCCKRVCLQSMRQPAYSMHVSPSRPFCKLAWKLMQSCALHRDSRGKLHCVCTGLLAFAAQAKYDSFILEIITIASATSLLSRVILGYWRLAQRYSSLIRPPVIRSGIHLCLSGVCESAFRICTIVCKMIIRTCVGLLGLGQAGLSTLPVVSISR